MASSQTTEFGQVYHRFVAGGELIIVAGRPQPTKGNLLNSKQYPE